MIGLWQRLKVRLLREACVCVRERLKRLKRLKRLREASYSGGGGL